MKLNDLLIKDAIQAKVNASDRDDVIHRSGQLLVNAGVVEERYAAAMKHVMDEFGPYCVIAPGIALLHARPEDGVIQACLSLITLEPPIEFGHSTNDPVDIAFALGATDKESHIEALAELAGFLSQDSFLKVIRSCETTQDLRKQIARLLE